MLIFVNRINLIRIEIVEILIISLSLVSIEQMQERIHNELLIIKFTSESDLKFDRTIQGGPVVHFCVKLQRDVQVLRLVVADVFQFGLGVVRSETEWILVHHNHKFVGFQVFP